MGKFMQPVLFLFERFSMIELSELSASAISNYFARNRLHLAESMPLRDARFYTESYWGEQITRYREARDVGHERRWFMCEGLLVIGHVSIDQIIKGPFQSCYLGYGIDAERQGHGLMREALIKLLDYVVRDMGLNRIMANYEPSNARSGRLLKTLGFEREGYARSYLKLNGRWRDHVLTSLVADEYLAGEGLAD